MSTFGIRQTFRTQPISRKIARTDVTPKNDDSQNQTPQTLQTPIDSNENLFDSNQNHFVNRVLNRSSSSVQQPALLPINQSSLSSLSSSSSSSSDTFSLTQSEKEMHNAKMVSSRISLLKSHNRAVTRSEDHM